MALRSELQSHGFAAGAERLDALLQWLEGEDMTCLNDLVGTFVDARGHAFCSLRVCPA